MKARKYWDVSCIDWKFFRARCNEFLENADYNSEEEFEKVCFGGDATEFLDSEIPILDLLCPKDYEQVKVKCQEIYDDCYVDYKNYLQDECGYNFIED